MDAKEELNGAAVESEETAEFSGNPGSDQVAAADDISRELETCQAECERLKDQCSRVAADLENYRRRVSKDQALWTQMAQDKVLSELLPILDAFERAVDHSDNGVSEEVKSWLSGFEMIHASFVKVLDSFGVSAMSDYIAFNPEYHEAIVQVDSEKHASGDIVEVLQKGYLKGDVVLRHARVSVAR